MRIMVIVCYFFVELFLEMIIFNDGVFLFCSLKIQKESFFFVDLIFWFLIDVGVLLILFFLFVYLSVIKFV